MVEEPEPWRAHTDGTPLAPLPEDLADESPTALSAPGAAPLPTRVASPWPSRSAAVDDDSDASDDVDGSDGSDDEPPKVESVLDLIDVAARAAAAEKDADALWGSPNEDAASVWDRGREQRASAAVWDDDAGIGFNGWDEPVTPAAAEPEPRDPRAPAASEGMADHTPDDHPEGFTYALTGEASSTPSAAGDEEPEAFRFGADEPVPAKDVRTPQSDDEDDDEPAPFTFGLPAPEDTEDDRPLSESATPRPDTGWVDLEAQETSTWSIPPLPVRRPGATTRPDELVGMGDLFGEQPPPDQPALEEPIDFDMFATAPPAEPEAGAAPDDAAPAAAEPAPEPSALEAEPEPGTAAAEPEPDAEPEPASPPLPVRTRAATAPETTADAPTDPATGYTDVTDDEDVTVEWDRDEDDAAAASAAEWDREPEDTTADWDELTAAAQTADPSVWGGEGLTDEDAITAVWQLADGDAEDGQAVWGGDADSDPEPVAWTVDPTEEPDDEAPAATDAASSPEPAAAAGDDDSDDSDDASLADAGTDTEPDAEPEPATWALDDDPEPATWTLDASDESDDDAPFTASLPQRGTPETSAPAASATHDDLAAALGDILDVGAADEPQESPADRPAVPGTPQMPDEGFDGLEGFDDLDDVLASAQQAADEAALDEQQAAPSPDASPPAAAPDPAPVQAPPPAPTDRVDAPPPAAPAPAPTTEPTEPSDAPEPAPQPAADTAPPAPTAPGMVSFSSSSAKAKPKKKRRWGR